VIVIQNTSDDEKKELKTRLDERFVSDHAWAQAQLQLFSYL
jgi:hypothetical protein